MNTIYYHLIGGGLMTGASLLAGLLFLGVF